MAKKEDGKRRTREHVVADLGVNHIERQVLLAGFTMHRLANDYGLDALVRTYDLVVGLAVFSLFTLESRWKRRRALAALHELRAIAHVVDMHQLAKDPGGLVRQGPAVSPAPALTTRNELELNRYLNYCNELLAIISKIAAVYVQDFPDAETVAAVDQIESLCSGLAQKVWQKIMVLQEMVEDAKRQTADRPVENQKPAPAN